MPFSFNFRHEGQKEDGYEGNGLPPQSGLSTSNIRAKEVFFVDKHIEALNNNLTVELFKISKFSSDKSVNGSSDNIEPCSSSDQSCENAEASTDCSSENTAACTLRFVNSETVACNLKAAGYSGPLTAALEKDSDLEPGVYEGGLKIWECSEDLVRHMAKSDHIIDLKNKKVLELGCGAGLPGLYCVVQGAQVDFADYNEEVLDQVTIPNVVLNSSGLNSESFNLAEIKDKVKSRFFAGDWGTLKETIFPDVTSVKDEDKYDLILTSETIYNLENTHKLIKIFQECLKTGTGQVYVAAKTFYFGVGGGVRSFQKQLETAGFSVSVADKFTDGVSREILVAKLS